MTREEISELRRNNLRNWHETATPEQKAEAIRKREETRKRNRNFHMLARYMMEAEIPTEDDARQELIDHGFDQCDYQAAVFFAQLKKAYMVGDTEAAKFVRDTAGYKPTESMQIGNLDDKPFMELDLSKLTNDELRAMIAKRENPDD